MSELPSERALRGRDVITLLLLVGGHVVFNALFAPIGSSVSDHSALWAYPAIGVLGVQPVLFAMWAGLGPLSFFKRLPWAVVPCVLAAYAGSIRSFRFVEPSSTNEDPFQAVFFSLAILFVATVLFLIIRRVACWRIHRHLVDSSATVSKGSQFSMKYLLGWTAGSAGLLALGRIIATGGGSIEGASDSRQTAAQIIGFLGFFCVLLLPTVGVPWIILAYERQAKMFVIATLIAWVVLTWLTVSLMQTLTPATLNDSVQTVVLVQSGAAIAGFITAILLRLSGFRLQRQ